jgi:hypothetical protein
MTNFKKSLESSVLKERLNRLMEGLERTNTSKSIIERYYANICSIEITEGTSTSKEVQKELTDLGLNESKIISTISSSVVPERKGTFSDYYVIEKISLLESLCRELNAYSWMKSVSGFIAETYDFMRENEMSILLERIVFDLENDKNSSYYKKAIETIYEAKTLENPISAILENTRDQKWIPLVGKLYEFCEKRRGNINGTNPNFEVSKIYSPVEFIEERGSYIFSVKGKIFETDSNTMMEYNNEPSNYFKSLLAITEASKFDTGIMRLYPNAQSTLDINFNEEQPRVFLNSKLVETKNIESALISGGYLRYTEKEKFAQIQQAIHEGNNVKELDFGYTVKSKLFSGVSVSVFSLNECVYVQKVNEGMKENTLVKAESAEDAITIVKDFMNYDISNSVKHLTEAEEARKVSKEKEISKKLDYLNSVYEKEVETIKNRVSFLKESLNDLDRVSRLNGIENTTKVLQAKALLESQIVKGEGDLSLQEMLIESATEKITGLDEAKKNNFSKKDFPIGAMVHTEDGVFIVSKGPNAFGFNDEKSKIWLKPHDAEAKRNYKGAGEYTIDVLNKKVTKIEESATEVNESALEIAGGIVLGLVGLKAIGFLAKGIFGTMKLKLMKDPNKLKDLADKIYDQAITKDNKKLLQGALWVNAVKRMIDKGEIKDGIQLFKTSLAMDKIDTNKIFEAEGFELNESCVPGKEYKIKGEAGWIYQGVSVGKHIFNNEVGGKHPINYDDAQFVSAHESGEIAECAM